MPTPTIGLGEHGRLMTRGAQWFNTVGGLTLLIGCVQLISAGFTLVRVTFFDGGPTGKTASGEFVDIRDQWNVTIATGRDVWILLNQPTSPPGMTFITQGYFAMVKRTPGNTSRVGNTRVTQNGGMTWGTCWPTCSMTSSPRTPHPS